MKKITKKTSVIELFKEMTKALSCKDTSYDWLIRKCNNQSSLASIKRKSREIYPMVLNTFKEYSNSSIKGGFVEVDRIRKLLKNKNSPTTKRKKITVEEINISLKDELDEANRTRAVLIRAYNDLNKITLDTLANSPAHNYDYDRHQKLYSDYLGINLVLINE